jgi:cytochrome b pre-mRNA-processing protein 3
MTLNNSFAASNDEKKMIFNPFRKNPHADAAYAVYNAIVAQSRHPDFYLHYGIKDNVTGRFDMIALHLSLVFHRLHEEDEKTKAFAQTLFDLFFKDMDRSLREMGVGDLTVPKKVKKMSELFYGLLGAIKDHFDPKDVDGLTLALSRNLFDPEDPENAKMLAHYCFGQLDHLDPQGQIDKGTLNLLPPNDAIKAGGGQG